MEKKFKILRKTRTFFLTIIDELDLAQLNKVPGGFNNNIAWNFGHVIAAQQGVCYKRAGLSMLIEEDLYNRYKPESKPAGEVGEDEMESLRSLLLSTIDDLEKDYRDGKFNGYKPWTTRYGVQIDSIGDAISFLSFHDGLHVGYTMALRRAVTG